MYAKVALRYLARRYQSLDTEIAQLDVEIRRLGAEANPALLAAKGVGLTQLPPCWSLPATTPNGCARNGPSLRCAAPVMAIAEIHLGTNHLGSGTLAILT